LKTENAEKFHDEELRHLLDQNRKEEAQTEEELDTSGRRGPFTDNPRQKKRARKQLVRLT
jgi:hypothetical protein